MQVPTAHCTCTCTIVFYKYIFLHFILYAHYFSVISCLFRDNIMPHHKIKNCIYEFELCRFRNVLPVLISDYFLNKVTVNSLDCLLSYL